MTNRTPEHIGLSNKKQRLLMLCHRVPFPPDRGDRIRAYHILQSLCDRYEVSIACTSDQPVCQSQQDVLQRFASRVAICRISHRYSQLRGLAALVRGSAITPACFYRQRLADTIRRWHRDRPFDVVLTYCTGMIDYARLLTGQKHASPLVREWKLDSPRHVIDLVDVDSVKWLDYARHSHWFMRWIYATESRRLRRIEAGWHDRFDGITVVSEAEARVYRKYVGHHHGLTVVRHAVDLDYFMAQPNGSGKTIVFVGVLDYKPNIEGITWFVEHVMPLLSQRVKDVRLQIVGRHPTSKVIALGQKSGVEVVGSVPDVREYLRDAVAVIAPLKIARGVQNKVLEAMASARPVVCSPGAADGIEAVNGQHLLVANSVQQWVDHLHCVLTDATLRTQLSTQARAWVQQRYTRQRCFEPLERLLVGDVDQRAEIADSLAALAKAA